MLCTPGLSAVTCGYGTLEYYHEVYTEINNCSYVLDLNVNANKLINYASNAPSLCFVSVKSDRVPWYGQGLTELPRLACW